MEEKFNHKIIYIMIFVSFIANVILCAFIYFQQPKIITFDIKGTTDIFLKQVTKLELDEKEKANLVKRFEKVTNEIIKEYESNHIILVKNAVLSQNIDDKTAEIKKKISEKMQQE